MNENWILDIPIVVVYFKVPNKVGRGLVLPSPCDILIFSSLGVPLIVSIAF